MKKYLSIAIVAVFTLGACNKKVDSTAYLASGIKENYFFKRGSYWIYKDSISGREDSCYLSFSSINIENSRAIPWPIEHLGIGFIQKPIDFNIKKQINWQLVFEKGDEIKGTYSNVDLGVAATFQGNYPLTPENQRLNPIIVEQFFNFQIGSKRFDTVSMVTYDNQIFYLKDGIGFVKVRINYKNDSVSINEVWELQRWHIVK